MLTQRPPPISIPPLKPCNTIINIHNGCDVCEGLIHDWLNLPLVQGEPFAGKIRPKALKRSAGDIAEILYRLIMNSGDCKKIIEEEFWIMILSEATKYNENWLEDQKIPEEHLHEFKEAEKKLFTQVILRNETRYDIDALKSLVEDKGCLNRDVDVKDWVGFWIMTLWEFIPTLHLEHQKLKPASGGGPAPGLRSFRPIPRPHVAPVVSVVSPAAAAAEMQLSPISSIPSIPSSLMDSLVQIMFEIDELYS